MTDVTETPLRGPAQEEDRRAIKARAEGRSIPKSPASRPARSEATRAALLSGPVLPTFHPAFLLRTPAAKAQAWRDLLSLKAEMQEKIGAI